MRWLKENRLLPRGYDAGCAHEHVSVRGQAASDADFTAGGDRVRYSVSVGSAPGPFTVTVELVFQPIGYRWAQNLSEYDSFETNRFIRYYGEMSAVSATVVATASAVLE